MTEISVVVPIYNEEESVELLVSRLHTALTATGRSYEIVLIDDGSKDNSWKKMKELSRQYPGLHLIQFRRNFGQTAAMSAGFRESHGEIIITMDADLQNDPTDIPKLLAEVDKGFDVVSGWRRDRKDTYINRRFPSMIANYLISHITGVHLHDYGCTLKAYRREIVQNIQLYGELHRFIPALASWVGGQISEVVVNHHARQFGTTKYGIGRTFRVILDLVTVKFLMRYSTRPIHIFGKWGMTFGALGFLMLFFMAGANMSYYFFGTEFCSELIKRPFWVITPFMLIFFGLQFISIGLLAELQIRTYHEAQQKPIYVIRESIEPTVLPKGTPKT
ncbi:MAG: glycosyltransferase family 2 protein [bacterium]